MNLSDQQRYVQCVLDLYRDTPGTSGRVRVTDRRLANSLYKRRIPLSIVRAALLLTVSRRTFRSSPDAEPLPTTPLGSAYGEVTAKSSKPSPFTSPTVLTAEPR